MVEIRINAMVLSPFHAYYKARVLENLPGCDRFVPAFASSDIEIYPYQIVAALFSLRSPYLKGAILCDDSSLGKSHEAMLVAVQKWHEGAKVAVIVTIPLYIQWKRLIEDKFTVPLEELNLMIYEKAVAKMDKTLSRHEQMKDQFEK